MKWFLLLLISPCAFSAEFLQGVQVQGSCEMKVVPDRGSVSFTAENQSKDQQEAVKKTNKQINELKESLNSLKLKDSELKTTSYHVGSIKEWEKDKMVDKGIRASMTLEISTSEISRLGEAMLKASKVGIQNVGSMMTFLSLEKSQAEYLKCLDIASNDAKKKADKLASKLGFKIGSVTNVIESPQTSRQPIPYVERSMMMTKSMGAASDSVSVEPGSQTFSTNIQVTFQIK